MHDLKISIIGGFYFSHKYNLLMSRERYQKLDEEEKKLDPRKYDNEYYWNYDMYTSKSVPLRWRVACMQGYFYSEEQKLIGDTNVKIGILSRRQYKRGGTRLNARGIDDDGYVGNFVETESFMVLNNALYIQTQIRGSIPLFWKQEGLKGEVKFKRDPMNWLKIFKKHFSMLRKDYGDVIMVNLLKESSDREQLLTTSVKYLLEKNSQEMGVTYYHHDFHHLGIKNLNRILEGTEEFITKHGYYCEDLSNNNVLKNQTGIVRTNCMDWLDRTNFAQTKLYLFSLQQQLEDAGIDLSQIYDESDFGQLGLPFTDIPKEKPLVNTIHSFWADNGDFISIHYTGTNSTITRVMKEGKKGFLSSLNHKYQDVHRFVNNNFTDNFKEECIKMMLGRSKHSVHHSIQEWDINDKIPNINLCVVTWNVGNSKAISYNNLNDAMPDMTEKDIVVFNLQEIVKLNAMFVLRK